MLFSDWHSYDHYGLAFVAFFGTLAAVFLIQWVMVALALVGLVQSLQGWRPVHERPGRTVRPGAGLSRQRHLERAHDRAMSAMYIMGGRPARHRRTRRHPAEPLGGELRAMTADYAHASAAEWPQLAPARRHRVLAPPTRCWRSSPTLRSPGCRYQRAGPAAAQGERHPAPITTCASHSSQTHVNPLEVAGDGVPRDSDPGLGGHGHLD